MLWKGTLGPLFGGAKDWNDDVFIGAQGSFGTFCACPRRGSVVPGSKHKGLVVINHLCFEMKGETGRRMSGSGVRRSRALGTSVPGVSPVLFSGCDLGNASWELACFSKNYSGCATNCLIVMP